jgi:hypothetical protein
VFPIYQNLWVALSSVCDLSRCVTVLSRQSNLAVVQEVYQTVPKMLWNTRYSYSSQFHDELTGKTHIYSRFKSQTNHSLKIAKATFFLKMSNPWTWRPLTQFAKNVIIHATMLPFTNKKHTDNNQFSYKQRPCWEKKRYIWWGYREPILKNFSLKKTGQ